MSNYADFAKAKSLVDNARHIAIICHISPDGDTLGSGLALYNSLKMYGKIPYIFCNGEPSDSLKASLPLSDRLNSVSRDAYDLAIAVDAADRERLGTCCEIFRRSKRTLVIDHHVSNKGFASVNVIVPSAAATAEIMYEFLMTLGARGEYIDDTTARLLYTAIVTDSGAFAFSSVTDHTHLVASKLLRYDFVASDIIYDVMRKKSKKAYELSSRVLARTKFYDNDRIGVICFRKDDFKATDTTAKDTEGIIVNVINVDSVIVAIAISEIAENSYKISLRTKEGVDASEIAAFFGGGGHIRAAGLRIDGYFEDVVEKIVNRSSLEIEDSLR